MARTFIEGFELGSTVPQENYAEGAVAVQSSIKRSGDSALRVNPTTTAAAVWMCGAWDGSDFSKTNGTLDGEYVKFEFYIATAPAANDEMFAAIGTSGYTHNCRLRLTSARTIDYYDYGGTKRGTGTTVLDLNTWYRIEMRLITNGTAHDFVVKINGQQEYAGTGANDDYGSMSYLFLGKYPNINGNSVDFYYDDVAIDDAAYPGSTSMARLDVTGNGSTWNFSGSYTAVDEIPPSAVDYVETSTAGNVALCALESCASAGISGTIKAVGMVSLLSRSGVGNAHMRLRSGGVNSDTASFDPTGTNAYRGRIRELDPSGAAWTVSSIDDLEAGIVSAAGNTGTIYLASVSTFVEFTPDSGASGVPPTNRLSLLGIG